MFRAVDVGILKSPPSIYAALVIACYQWWFAFAYFWSQIFGQTIGNFIFKSYHLFVTIFHILRISSEKMPRRVNEVHVGYCYPYFHYWLRILSLNPGTSGVGWGGSFLYIVLLSGYGRLIDIIMF